MENYWIQVFNRQIVQPFPGEELMKALLEANFQSLSQEYGLNPALIAPALAHLELLASENGIAPYLLLNYQIRGQSPLVVYRWRVDEGAGAHILQEAKKRASRLEVQAHLTQTREILAISLRPSQLEDMGLLLAYEVARWWADRGQGVVFGLDGTWYRVNRHQAFVPLVDGPQD